MKKTTLIFYVSLVIISLSLLSAKDITGTYSIEGGAEGSTYSGELFIEENGDVYEVYWELGSGEIYAGLGILQGNYLAVAYTDETFTAFGVVLYVVKGNNLSGFWAAPGNTYIKGYEIAYKDSERVDVFEPQVAKFDLEGYYYVTGSNPDGSEYEAEVEIIEEDNLYLVKWLTYDTNFYGLGIVDRDKLIVAWFDEGDYIFGISYLKLKSTGVLEGPWAIYGVNELGEEYWEIVE